MKCYPSLRKDITVHGKCTNIARVLSKARSAESKGRARQITTYSRCNSVPALL